MGHYRKVFLKLSMSLSLAGLFLWASFRQVNLNQIRGSIEQVDPFWLIVSTVILVLINFVRARRWQVLIAPVSRDVSIWRGWMAIMIGYAGNNLLPRAGEIIRVLALKRGKGLSASALLATVVVERVIDLLGLVLLLAGSLFAFRQELSAVFPWLEGVCLAGFFGSVLLLALFGVLATHGERALKGLDRGLSSISQSLAGKVVSLLRAFFQGMGAIRSKAGYAEIFVSTVILYAGYILVVYLPFLSFDFDQKYGLDFSAALVVTVMATIGIILPTPGGTGTYHYFCSQTLHHLYDVSLAEALAFATVIHGIAYFTFLAIGGPSLLTLLIYPSHPSNVSEQNRTTEMRLSDACKASVADSES